MHPPERRTGDVTPAERYLADYKPHPAMLSDVVESAVRSCSGEIRWFGHSAVVEAVLPEVQAVAMSGGLEKPVGNGRWEADVRDLVRRCLQMMEDEQRDLHDREDDPEEAEEFPPGVGRVYRIIAPHCCIVRANVDGRGTIRVCVPKELSGGSFPQLGDQVKVRARLDYRTKRAEPTAEILEVM